MDEEIIPPGGDDAVEPSDHGDHGDHGDHEGLADRLRDMPVGVKDPNIIGDAGPTDVPPGSDPPSPPAVGEELAGEAPA